MYVLLPTLSALMCCSQGEYRSHEAWELLALEVEAQVSGYV